MDFERVSNWRMRIVIIVFVTLAVVVVGRLIYIQVVQHQQHDEFANRTWTIETKGPRGALLDRYGFPLATSVDGWEVHVDTWLWSRSQFQSTDASRRLAELLRAPEAIVLSLALQTSERGGRDALVAYVSDDLGAQIHAESLHGVYVTKTSSRRYPEGAMAAQVIGIVGRDEQGLAGLEWALEGTLAGESGVLVYEQDALGQPIPFGNRAELPYRQGADVVLTIDRNLQRIAEQALADAVAEWNAAGGVIIIMDPNNGDLLAVATLPSFNPAEFDLADPDVDLGLLRSTVASDVYEPGSVFKVITMAGAIDMGLVTPWSTFVDTGAAVIGDKTIRNFDLSYHGEQTMTQVLQRSLNTGTVWLSQQMGFEAFYDYLYRFGLGSETNSGLPGESAGILIDRDHIAWSPVQMATTSFGQGVGVTPMQIVQAISTIARGGELIHPRLVRSIITSDGVQSFEPTVGERVISRTAAEDLKMMMQAVVDGVLGHPAQTPGWSVAGKSGTSDVAEGGGYLEGESLASFVGFAPVDRPRLVVLIRIDRPQGDIHGGTVAAPVFSTVVEAALPYLGVPPTSYVARPQDWLTGPDQGTVPEHRYTAAGDNAHELEANEDPNAEVGQADEQRPDSDPAPLDSDQESEPVDDEEDQSESDATAARVDE